MKGDTSLLERASRLSIGGFRSVFAKARETGELNTLFQDLLFFETNHPGEVIVSTTRIYGKDPTDPFELSAAETKGRRQAEELVSFIRKSIPGFCAARVLYTGPPFRRICPLTARIRRALLLLRQNRTGCNLNLDCLNSNCSRFFLRF